MARFAVLAPLILLAACTGAAAGPEEVATAFARKWEAGDCAGIGALVTSERGILGGGVEQVCLGRAALRKGPAKEVSEIRVVEAREDGDRAVVRLETRYRDGAAAGGEPIVLVRQADGGWKVDLLATGASRARGLLTRERDIPAPASPAPPVQPAAPGNIV